MRKMAAAARGVVIGPELELVALAAASLIALLNALDLFTTGLLLHQRGGYEANPLSAWLLAHGLLPGAKAGLVVAVVALAWLVGRRRWAVRALWTVAAAYVLVVASNALQLVR